MTNSLSDAALNNTTEDRTLNDLQPESEPRRKAADLQNPFLTAHQGKRVVVYLLNGIRLTGTLRSFDQFTLLLDNNGQQQLVFKHACATVMPDTGRPDARPTVSRRQVRAAVKVEETNDA